MKLCWDICRSTRGPGRPRHELKIVDLETSDENLIGEAKIREKARLRAKRHRLNKIKLLGEEFRQKENERATRYYYAKKATGTDRYYYVFVSLA